MKKIIIFISLFVFGLGYSYADQYTNQMDMIVNAIEKKASTLPDSQKNSFYDKFIKIVDSLSDEVKGDTSISSDKSEGYLSALKYLSTKLGNKKSSSTSSSSSSSSSSSGGNTTKGTTNTNTNTNSSYTSGGNTTSSTNSYSGGSSSGGNSFDRSKCYGILPSGEGVESKGITGEPEFSPKPIKLSWTYSRDFTSMQCVWNCKEGYKKNSTETGCEKSTTTTTNTNSSSSTNSTSTNSNNTTSSTSNCKTGDLAGGGIWKCGCGALSSPWVIAGTDGCYHCSKENYEANKCSK